VFATVAMVLWAAMAGPFISQIATSPVSLRQRMSLCPSPSKSATPTIVHAASTVAMLS
jgi:hypothetical protein